MSTHISYRHQLLREKTSENGKIFCFRNCRLFREAVFVQRQELWVRDGYVLEPLEIFYGERKRPTIYVDCEGLILAPGFLDIQVNGAFGVDFTTVAGIASPKKAGELIRKVTQGILQYGVTGFCPTLISAEPEKYRNFLGILSCLNFEQNAAGILGAHFEGPFISKYRCGCHPTDHIISSLKKIRDIYGDDLSRLSIVTLAPELEGADEALSYLCQKGVKISIGHSNTNFTQANAAIKNGARSITHLFNQTSFHHREPGIVGLLTATREISKLINAENYASSTPSPLYYGLITDGVHLSESAIQMAFSANPEGVILVTDSISALGLDDDVYQIGGRTIELQGNRAYVKGTQIMAGSVSSMLQCVKFFAACIDKLPNRNGQCEALKAATYSPAKFLDVDAHFGTLATGTKADFILIDDHYNLHATFIDGIKCF